MTRKGVRLSWERLAPAGALEGGAFPGKPEYSPKGSSTWAVGGHLNPGVAKYCQVPAGKESSPASVEQGSSWVWQGECQSLAVFRSYWISPRVWSPHTETEVLPMGVPWNAVSGDIAPRVQKRTAAQAPLPPAALGSCPFPLYQASSASGWQKNIEGAFRPD